ncbi:uncharacterized protein [Ambystoma mexicanum]
MCTATWTGEYCTDHAKACLGNSCINTTTCVDSAALEEGFTCGPCPPGLAGDGYKCFDINECMGTAPVCEQICTNTFLGYACSCRPGYRVSSSDASKCQDINECDQSNHMCPNTSRCTNTDGSYRCQCLAGFTGPNCSAFSVTTTLPNLANVTRALSSTNGPKALFDFTYVHEKRNSTSLWVDAKDRTSKVTDFESSAVPSPSDESISSTVELAMVTQGYSDISPPQASSAEPEHNVGHRSSSQSKNAALSTTTSPETLDLHGNREIFTSAHGTTTASMAKPTLNTVYADISLKVFPSISVPFPQFQTERQSTEQNESYSTRRPPSVTDQSPASHPAAMVYAAPTPKNTSISKSESAFTMPGPPGSTSIQTSAAEEGPFLVRAQHQKPILKGSPFTTKSTADFGFTHASLSTPITHAPAISSKTEFPTLTIEQSPTSVTLAILQNVHSANWGMGLHPIKRMSASSQDETPASTSPVHKTIHSTVEAPLITQANAGEVPTKFSSTASGIDDSSTYVQPNNSAPTTSMSAAAVHPGIHPATSASAPGQLTNFSTMLPSVAQTLTEEGNVKTQPNDAGLVNPLSYPTQMDMALSASTSISFASPQRPTNEISSPTDGATMYNTSGPTTATHQTLTSQPSFDSLITENPVTSASQNITTTPTPPVTITSPKSVVATRPPVAFNTIIPDVVTHPEANTIVSLLRTSSSNSPGAPIMGSSDMNQSDEVVASVKTEPIANIVETVNPTDMDISVTVTVSTLLASPQRPTEVISTPTDGEAMPTSTFSTTATSQTTTSQPSFATRRTENTSTSVVETSPPVAVNTTIPDVVIHPEADTIAPSFTRDSGIAPSAPTVESSDIINGDAAIASRSTPPALASEKSPAIGTLPISHLPLKKAKSTKKGAKLNPTKRTVSPSRSPVHKTAHPTVESPQGAQANADARPSKESTTAAGIRGSPMHAESRNSAPNTSASMHDGISPPPLHPTQTDSPMVVTAPASFTSSQVPNKDITSSTEERMHNRTAPTSATPQTTMWQPSIAPSITKNPSTSATQNAAFTRTPTPGAVKDHTSVGKTNPPVDFNTIAPDVVTHPVASTNAPLFARNSSISHAAPIMEPSDIISGPETGDSASNMAAGQCGFSACPMAYCYNGGDCTLTLPDCAPACKCTSGLRGAPCTMAGHTFMPQPFKEIPTRQVDIKITLIGHTGSSIGSPGSDVRTTLLNSINATVSQILRTLPLDVFDKNSNIDLFNNLGEAVTIVTSEFSYSNNHYVLIFLNDLLSASIVKAFNQRAARKHKLLSLEFAPIATDDITTRRILYKDDLEKYFICSISGYAGYFLEYANVGFLCVSPCLRSYCQHDGVCQHTETGPHCRCVPFAIFVPYGECCEYLAVDFNAFVGILFGALIFLTLLMFCLWIGVHCCRTGKHPMLLAVLTNRKKKQHIGAICLSDANTSETGSQSHAHRMSKNLHDKTTLEKTSGELPPNLTDWRPQMHSSPKSSRVQVRADIRVDGRCDAQKALIWRDNVLQGPQETERGTAEMKRDCRAEKMTRAANQVRAESCEDESFDVQKALIWRDEVLQRPRETKRGVGEIKQDCGAKKTTGAGYQDQIRADSRVDERSDPRKVLIWQDKVFHEAVEKARVAAEMKRDGGAEKTTRSGYQTNISKPILRTAAQKSKK